MLNQKYFGLPLWVWLVVASIVIYSYNKSQSQSKPKASGETKVLAEKKEKFSDVSTTNSNTKIKIFNFNTEWCGWSRRFQPEWDAFTKAISSDNKLNDKVEAFDVKCDNPEKESMCEAYGVPGYPYVIAEVNGKRTPYNGERTAKALLEFVSSI